MNKELDEFLVLLIKQKEEADQQAITVAANSVIIGREEAECQELANIALADLQEAMPALEEAIRVCKIT